MSSIEETEKYADFSFAFQIVYLDETKEKRHVFTSRTEQDVQNWLTALRPATLVRNYLQNCAIFPQKRKISNFENFRCQHWRHQLDLMRTQIDILRREVSIIDSRFCIARNFFVFYKFFQSAAD